MRRLIMSFITLLVVAGVASVAVAATDPARPPAGSYTFGASKGGFKINQKRTALTGLRFTFTVGPTSDVDCTSSTLPTGKVTASVTTPLKLVAAHRGGYTTYIIGRSTPKTSSGITPISKLFHLSTGGTVTGTMSLAFRYDDAKTGDGAIVIDDCTLTPGFKHR